MSLTMKAALTILTSLSLAIPAFAQIPPTEAALRTAIAAGGSITFNSSGAIPLAIPLVVGLDTTIDGAGQTILIDGVNATRLFEVNTNVHLTLRNLILANGKAKGEDAGAITEPGQAGIGGALKNSGGFVTLVNCTFSNNVAIAGKGFVAPLTTSPYYTVAGESGGGAIWQTGGSLTVQGGAFITNTATGAFGTGQSKTRGGAIYSSGGSITIDRATFDANTAYGYTAAEGGAIFSENGNVLINSARLTRNGSAATSLTAYGGAISASGGNLDVSNSLFSQNGVAGGFGPLSMPPNNYNGAPGYGGAIYLASTMSANIHESAFDGNNSRGGLANGVLAHSGSGFGGAVYVEGSLALANATFVNNFATEGTVVLYPAPPSEGGAIFSKGTVGATNITVVSNNATTAALTAASGSFVIKNSLFGKNFGVTASAGIMDAGNNLSSSDSPAFTESSSHQVASLKIGPFGDYGGPTPTVPLLAGSPAIDAGDDSAAPPIDQRGRTRPFGAHSDVGAFESSAPFYIFGKLNGYLNSSQTVTLSAETVTPDSTGTFHLFLPQGINSLTLAGTNTVFSPNPLIIDAQADMDASANAYQLEALAGDISDDPATFVFAGRASETWEFDVSNDLVNWTPVHTNTFATEGVYSMPLTNVAFPVFMRALKSN